MKVLSLLLVGCLTVPSSAFAATIKKKNGDVVEGKIEGLIALKEPAQEEVDKDKASVKKYSIWYWLVNGEQILRIDEAGVERQTDDVEGVGFATREGANPNDLVVLDKMFETRNPIPFLVPTSDPSTWVVAAGRVRSKQGQTLAGSLLGEYRREPRAAQGMLIPVIRVSTPNGTVGLTVGEIISFKVPASANTQR